MRVMGWALFGWNEFYWLNTYTLLILRQWLLESKCGFLLFEQFSS